jgi:pimeloyl-ACP methyl ester carboxylesterase
MLRVKRKISDKVRRFANHFHVFVPDLRNHGQSPHNEDFSYHFMVLDMLEFFKDQKIEHFNMIGHSMGGKLAMHIALDYPELVNKMVVGDISPVNYPINESNEIIKIIKEINLPAVSNRQELNQMIHSATKNNLLQGLILKNISSKNENGFYWKSNTQSILNNLENIYSFNSNNKKPFNKKVLFLKSDNEMYVSEKHYPEISEFFPNNEIKTIRDTGHWLHAEKPDEFYDICINYLL